jgi:hypothetical protein
MEGIQHLHQLEKLELYDNHIEVIQEIDFMHNLTILDLSFNSIREMVPLVGACPLLQELYVAQNKLRRIEGLEGMAHLKTLDLGANRIRVIEGLDDCAALESLWLGKNKIELISGLTSNTQIKQLDIQNNRLTQLGDGLQGLSALSELYLAWNAIENVVGLPSPSNLNTVDLSTNKLNSLEGVEQHTTLEELWLSSSLMETFESLTPLTKLPGMLYCMLYVVCRMCFVCRVSCVACLVSCVACLVSCVAYREMVPVVTNPRSRAPHTCTTLLPYLLLTGALSCALSMLYVLSMISILSVALSLAHTTHHTSHITHHTSHITHHTSHIKHHRPQVPVPGAQPHRQGLRVPEDNHSHDTHSGAARRHHGKQNALLKQTDTQRTRNTEDLRPGAFSWVFCTMRCVNNRCK